MTPSYHIAVIRLPLASLKKYHKVEKTIFYAIMIFCCGNPSIKQNLFYFLSYVKEKKSFSSPIIHILLVKIEPLDFTPLEKVIPLCQAG